MLAVEPPDKEQASPADVRVRRPSEPPRRERIAEIELAGPARHEHERRAANGGERRVGQPVRSRREPDFDRPDHEASAERHRASLSSIMMNCANVRACRDAVWYASRTMNEYIRMTAHQPRKFATGTVNQSGAVRLGRDAPGPQTEPAERIARACPCRGSSGSATNLRRAHRRIEHEIDRHRGGAVEERALPPRKLERVARAHARRT